jgi:hypothetical protein
MKSLSIDVLRLNWSAAEKALEREAEIIITRNGKPGAKLIRLHETPAPRRRFDPKAHMARMRKIFNGRTLPSIDTQLQADRNEN